MESIRQLRRLVAQVVYDGSKAEARKRNEISEFLENALSIDGAFFDDRVPTVDVLIYAINTLRYPSLPPGLYPQFLDLISMVEFYRMAALEKARTALVWNEFYTNSPSPDVITLLDTEESFLRELESRNNSMRKVYMKIVVNSCKADMYNLLLASPLSITNYMVRYYEYFPFFQADFKSPLLLHRTLSEKETQEIREAGRECSEWVCEGYKWAQEFKMNDQPAEDVFQLDDFRLNFPYPDKCSSNDMAKIIDYYLDAVKFSVERLEEMFGMSTSN